MSDLVKGKLYVSKYGKVWHVQKFLGFDKMEAEFQILGEFPTEDEANKYRKLKEAPDDQATN